MTKIHFNTLRYMLQQGEPVDIRLWTSKGEIQEWRNAMPLTLNHYAGTQRFKLLDSGQIRQARLVCIFMINGNEVHL